MGEGIDAIFKEYVDFLRHAAVEHWSPTYVDVPAPLRATQFVLPAMCLLLLPLSLLAAAGDACERRVPPSPQVTQSTLYSPKVSTTGTQILHLHTHDAARCKPLTVWMQGSIHAGLEG